MLRLGRPKKRKIKKKQARKAPAKAKARLKAKPGDLHDCGWCGETHVLIPCSNESEEFRDWLFYYCDNRLKMAQCSSPSGEVLGPFVEVTR